MFKVICKTGSKKHFQTQQHEHVCLVCMFPATNTPFLKEKNSLLAVVFRMPIGEQIVNSS